MTTAEITKTFVDEITKVTDEQMVELLRYGADEHFSDEAGTEFMQALAYVGLSRVVI
jgi:hypothetical protein